MARRKGRSGGGRLADKEERRSTRPSGTLAGSEHIYDAMGRGNAGTGGMSGHRSHGSPASIGAAKGRGSVLGGGEMPPKGPGRAAERKMGMPDEAYPSRATPGNPSGISVYKEGNAPPKGYRQ